MIVELSGKYSDGLQEHASNLFDYVGKVPFVFG